MGQKIRINITVDEEIHKTTKELGFNVSKLCENAMKDAINRMRGPNSLNKPHLSNNLSVKNKIKTNGATAGIWTRVKGLEGLCPRPG